ncbi:MAG TPA: hypothetical protein VM388_07295 [Acidimicrobiales bacterium]|nr:hypothetical protein [Acidimicrobiales bacterium]
MLRPVLAVLVMTGAITVIGAEPASACSCRADVAVADALAESDGAFVGVFIGRDDPAVPGEVVSSGRRVLNHFQVERSVKGDIGERVDVRAAAGGASCGLELEAGDRTGLLLRRDGGVWTSSLCSQVEPRALLAVAPGTAPGPAGAGTGAGVNWGFMVFAGLLVLALPVALVAGGRRRRSP